MLPPDNLLAVAFAKGGDRGAFLEVSSFRLHCPSYSTHNNFHIVKCHKILVIMLIEMIAKMS